MVGSSAASARPWRTCRATAGRHGARDDASQSFDDVVAHFCAMVADHRATVHRIDDAAATVAAILADAGVTRVVVPVDLPADLRARIGNDIEVVVDGPVVALGIATSTPATPWSPLRPWGSLPRAPWSSTTARGRVVVR